LSPVRALLPISAACFVLPIFTDELYTVVWLPFLNFPYVIEALHATPVYFEDLAVDKDGKQETTFQLIYNVTMSFLLALIFAGVSDYVILQGIENKPLIEVTATVYANLALFMRIQNTVGSVLMTVCYEMKKSEVVTDTLRRISGTSSEGVEIEMSKVADSPDAQTQTDAEQGGVPATEQDNILVID
jgi:uncharacterized Tic20 family protein